MVSETYVKKNDIPIIAPEGFEVHAVSENVYAGTAMGRRAGYQYGTFLEKNPQGAMAIGIGIMQSTGGEGKYLVTVKSGVVLYQKGVSSEQADATLTMTKEQLIRMISQDTSLQGKTLQIEGDKGAIEKLTENMVTFDGFFHIIEP